MVRVFHCDDSLAYRRLIGALLEPEPDIEVVGEAADHRGTIEGVAQTQPDVVLLDMVVGAAVPDLSAELERAAPGVRLLILSGHPPEAADPALSAAAVGHVRKTVAMEQLASAIRAAASH